LSLESIRSLLTGSPTIREETKKSEDEELQILLREEPMLLKVRWKIVVASATTKRYVFWNPKTGRQVAVFSWSETGGTKLSVPIEGMGGWHVSCTWDEACRIANRECYRRGWLFNRLVSVPSFFLQDRLS
jgi:hypothetical protein